MPYLSPHPHPHPHPNPNPNQAVYLEGTAGGREGGAADTLVGRVVPTMVPTDGVGAPAGAAAVADEQAYLYTEEFWVDGDEVDGVYSPRSSEP